MAKTEVVKVADYFDPKKMQGMQDAFSEANHVYLFFVDRDQNIVTSLHGTSVEKEYVNGVFSAETLKDYVLSFSDLRGEEIIEFPTDVPGAFVRGIAVRAESDYLLGAWIVIGFDAETVIEERTVAHLRVTTAEAFDHSITLLDVLMSNYFANKSQLVLLGDDYEELAEEEKRMENLLQKTNVLTEILRMMESEGQFTEVIERILREAGKYLRISNAHLLKVESDETRVELICEWADEKEHLLQEKFIGLDRNDYPFMTGRPYTISSDTAMPENFIEFFSRNNFSCGAFLPINVNEKTAMYLCFVVIGDARKWNAEDLNFINDIKRVVQTVLIKRVTKNSLASSYSALESILENTGCGVAVVDENNHVLYTNETYKELHLVEEDERALERLIIDDNRKSTIEFRAKASGRWFELSFSAMEWVDGRPVELVTIYDISKTKKYQERIEHQANDDYLTGLYNRRRFEEDFAKEIRRTVRSGGESALLYVGLDDFANINDGLGHQAGDELLKEVAGALQRVPGVQDACYRIGGDEFMLLVKNEYADRLDSIIAGARRIFDHPWKLEGNDYYMTISMGVVIVPRDGVEPDLLMQRAMIALHTAKNLGKNRIEYYNSQQLSSAVERLDLEKNMREAVEHGCDEFEVYYQPIIDVRDGKTSCCGAEALVRWNSSVLGMVQPVQFISLAESLGLINAIGKHVLFEATKRCKYWNDFGHPEYKVNVNLSVVQLLQNDIIDIVRASLDRSGLNPNNLTLEVTEGLAIHDMTRMQQILGQIKDMGVRVALDDFGTGYSSLNHLRSMPIDVIKIDKCFIEGIGEDDFSEVFVKSVSQLADSLNMNICVEGVEQEKQKDVLGNMNVDMIQGYLFDKPLTVDEFEQKYLFEA